jgi:DNA-binding transcriptional LysR family regulator
MRYMHEFLSTAPFDLYELHLFHLVAQHQSFTKAAAAAGLTQSAVTRQMQGIEASLGVDLFERTTRSVRLTPAGKMLLEDSGRVLDQVQGTLQRLREDFTDAKKQIAVGVSRSIGLAYLPGFFHANLRRLPQVSYQVAYQSSASILHDLETNRLDLGVLCPPVRLPQTVRTTHQFDDDFALIAPANGAEAYDGTSCKSRRKWAEQQNWLLIDEASNTGILLRSWMKKAGLEIEAGMQLDSFDLIVNLVALGMGVSFVPLRALRLNGRKRGVVQLPWPDRFRRELVVVMRRNRKVPQHLAQFVDNVLF